MSMAHASSFGVSSYLALRRGRIWVFQVVARLLDVAHTNACRTTGTVAVLARLARICRSFAFTVNALVVLCTLSVVIAIDSGQ